MFRASSLSFLSRRWPASAPRPRRAFGGLHLDAVLASWSSSAGWVACFLHFPASVLSGVSGFVLCWLPSGFSNPTVFYASKRTAKPEESRAGSNKSKDARITEAQETKDSRKPPWRGLSENRGPAEGLQGLPAGRRAECRADGPEERRSNEPAKNRGSTADARRET